MNGSANRRAGVRWRALAAWCLFDWANSAFPTVVTTFVVAAYFTKAVAADEIAGAAQWGAAASLSALAITLLAPLAGAVADHGGRRKPWLLAATALCVAATAGLWFVRPVAGQGADVWLALVLVAVGTFAFETGMVFYNAMLPGLVPPAMVGRASGWGWGLGYFGGLACLAVALFGLVRAEPPPFGLDPAAAEPVRATVLLVALWFALFALPLFLLAPDAPASGLKPAEAVRRGLATLLDTLRRIRDYRDIAWFLLAHVVYIDGLNTLFAFGGIYAAGTFDMDFDELIVFGIAMNVTAGLGAAAFAWVDDWLGPKRTVLIAIGGTFGLGAALVLVESKALFWGLALPIGVFVGPMQAASRSLMAHLAPSAMRAEMFGLFAFSGKATAFVGPALFGGLTAAFASQRAGVAAILVFLAAGFLLLLKVPDVRGTGGPDLR